jgi:hypothetical protein
MKKPQISIPALSLSHRISFILLSRIGVNRLKLMGLEYLKARPLLTENVMML